VIAGIGFALAIISMSAIRFKLKYSNIPDGLKGLGITMILTGLISMAYLAFSGIQL
jgi:Na+-transporting NADH:ubiquinone oxidoreductase subunit E